MQEETGFAVRLIAWRFGIDQSILVEIHVKIGLNHRHHISALNLTQVVSHLQHRHVDSSAPDALSFFILSSRYFGDRVLRQINRSYASSLVLKTVVPQSEV